jgi:TRAP-type C4-dicarboxylate transport system substrate-binding protein
MKRALALVSALSLCFALLTGCASSDAGEYDKVYKLTFSIHDPKDSLRTLYFEQLAEQTSQATDGKVQITVVPDGKLLASTDVAEGVPAGTADMGWLLTTFFPGQFPLSEAVTLPMLFEDSYVASQVLLDLYERSPELQDELKSYKVLQLYTNPINTIFTNKEIQSVSDLKGLHIRATTGVATDIVAAWGGSPLLMGPEEIYRSVEEGVLDAMVFEWSGFDVYDLGEVVRYCVDVPVTCGVFMTVMNQETYNSLPAPYQAAIDEIWGSREVSMECARAFLEDADAAREKGVQEYGMTVIELSDRAAAEFRAVADDYVEAWVEDMTTDAFDAQAYLELLLALKAQYEPQ